MFDSNDFSVVASEVVERIRRYLSVVNQAPARPYETPKKMIERALHFMELPPVRGADLKVRAAEISQAYLEYAHRLHSPRSMGHQVVPPVPEAAAFELLGSVANNATGIFEMGPFATAIERAVIQKLLPFLGWEKHGDGVATSGGSLANMTGILAARNITRPGTWNEGVRTDLAVVTSADSHYSVSRAAGIAGLGTNNVLKVKLDSKRRVDCEALRSQLKETKHDVFAIVGSACATPIGAFDDLTDMASVAREFGLWFHVDAAHGGGLLLSKNHRTKLKGLELADSVIWDAHKMMFVPSLCTFLLYRDKKHSFETFSQDAPYLLASQDALEIECDSARRVVECTKRPISLALWALWSLYGEEYLGKLVDTTIEATRKLYEKVQAHPDFSVIHEPECNILCFRYEPARIRGLPTDVKSKFQSDLRRKILEQGQFYLTGTFIDGVYALRVTVMNPTTGEGEFDALLKHIEAIAP